MRLWRRRTPVSRFVYVSDEESEESDRAEIAANVRWRPFASALWALVPEWQERCAAELAMTDQSLSDVCAPCTLGLVLESAVPFDADGWGDPGMKAFFQFVEVAYAARASLISRGDFGPDFYEFDCLLGATLPSDLAARPIDSQVVFPYLGPETAAMFRSYATLPSHKKGRRGIDLTRLSIGTDFEPISLDPNSLLPTDPTP